MKIESHYSYKAIYVIFALSVILLIIFFSGFRLDGAIAKYVEAENLGILGAALIGIIALAGTQFFQFDGGGEVLIFKSNHILLGWLPKYRQIIEIPKYKLEGYRIDQGFIRKALFISIRRKNGRVTSTKFPITFLDREDIRELDAELEKVMETRHLSKLNANE